MQFGFSSGDADNMTWRCVSKIKKKKRKTKYCRFKCSIRRGTIFERSHLSIFQILSFINYWVNNKSRKYIQRDLHISLTTIADLSSFCREVVSMAILNLSIKIGGPNKHIEIYESKFGNHVEDQWVFGGIEKESGKCFMCPVNIRDKYSLLAIIMQYIHPGTTIISDCWKTYNCIKDERFKQLTVNHSIYFVDPIINDTNDESMWDHIKTSHSNNTKKKIFFGRYMARYLFSKSCYLKNLDPTLEFFKIVGNIYNGSSITSIENDIEDI